MRERISVVATSIAKVSRQDEEKEEGCGEAMSSYSLAGLFPSKHAMLGIRLQKDVACSVCIIETLQAALESEHDTETFLCRIVPKLPVR